MNNNIKIIEKDIDSIYLGNLKTIEFDLKLPKKGKFGSNIIWESSDERFITNEGIVTRPSYGRGDRVIQLTGVFSIDKDTKKKVYDVNVLEEENNIVVEKIYPIEIIGYVGQKLHLPQAIAIKTQDGKVISHSVEWNEIEISTMYENEQVISGFLKDTDYKVAGSVKVVRPELIKVNKEKKQKFYSLKEVELSGHTLEKQSQDERLEFLLKVDDDQMLYNFKDASGLDTKNAPEMIGWDSPDSLLKGHTTGHYMSALALAYASTGNKKILEKINYMIDELMKVQDEFETKPNFHYGFLSGYSEEQFDLLEEYKPYPEIWAPYYTLHKIFAGLLDIYRLANNKKALVIADKLGDWVYERLSKLDEQQLKRMWGMYIAGEFGGMNESLAELYEYTNKENHLMAAKMFDNDRLFFPMLQKVDALGTLHANQHIPQAIGALKIFDSSHEEKYFDIAKFFWDSVVSNHTYSIGGTGDGEMFQQPNEIGSKIDKNTAESCASYNMLKLTKDLTEYEPSTDKFEYYERVMKNHILSSTDHKGMGASTYFMPLQPGAIKEFDDENSCCHGTGLENHFKYGEAIYSSTDSDVYINLFVSSKLKSQDGKVNLEMIAEDEKPEFIEINNIRTDKDICIRIPSWSDKTSIKLDGKEMKFEVINGYVKIPKSTKKVEINFKVSLKKEVTADIKTIYSLKYGPYILAGINESEEYLNFDDVLKEVHKDDGSLSFSSKQGIFEPLAFVNNEKYHIYLEDK